MCSNLRLASLARQKYGRCPRKSVVVVVVVAVGVRGSGEGEEDGEVMSLELSTRCMTLRNDHFDASLSGTYIAEGSSSRFNCCQSSPGGGGGRGGRRGGR